MTQERFHSPRGNPVLAGDEVLTVEGGVPKEKRGESFISGAAWSTGGEFTRHALKLISNLILTRLLFPEAFGLMALIGVFLQAMEMFSDFGMSTSIVQNKRGDDPAFLDTVWVIQILRGALLYSLSLPLAWAAASIYNRPEFVYLLPVAALSAPLTGFTSTIIPQYRRHLQIKRLIVIELSADVLRITVTIVWALLHPSIWALIGGGLAGPLFRLVVSHCLRSEHRNRLRWDPAAARAVFDFGKWIFLSSMLFFLGRMADRFILGRVVGMELLGIYSIALLLTQPAAAVVQKVNSYVLFPTFSKATRDGSTDLKGVYYGARLKIDAFILTGTGGLMACGSWVVSLLYDDRYLQAGWMLQILCLKVAMASLVYPLERYLNSQGLTKYNLVATSLRTAWMLLGIPLGWHVAQIHGIVWAVALSEVPVFFVLWPVARRLRVFSFARELLSFSLLGLGLLLGNALLMVLDLLGLR